MYKIDGLHNLTIQQIDDLPRGTIYSRNCANPECNTIMRLGKRDKRHIYCCKQCSAKGRGKSHTVHHLREHFLKMRA